MSGEETAGQIHGSSSKTVADPARSTPRSDDPGSPGSGRFRLSTSSRVQFSQLSASYPLKLLSPTPLPSQPRHIGVVYTLAYGGGLVAGDVVSLQGEIDHGAGLVMLTQGSTKIFKHRQGLRPSSLCPPNTRHKAHLAINSKSVDLTRQRLLVTLQPGSFLLLLPDSVSPYRGSKYAQSQRFVLPDSTASILILDWVNSGRGQRSSGTPTSLPMKGAPVGFNAPGEIWSMDKYISTNEVLIGDRLVMREKLALEGIDGSIALRLAPYHVYATILILGPHFGSLLRHMTSLCDATRQYKISTPPGVLWSFSPLEGGKGGVLRVAAEEVEEARSWIRSALDAGGIRELVGEGLWPRII